jgi:hypothetical protein
VGASSGIGGPIVLVGVLKRSPRSSGERRSPAASSSQPTCSASRSREKVLKATVSASAAASSVARRPPAAISSGVLRGGAGSRTVPSFA